MTFALASTGPRWRRFVEDALVNQDTASYRRTMRALLVLVMLSIGLVAAETSDDVSARYRTALDLLETAVAVVFSIEYLANVSVARPWWRYVFSWSGLIDVLAIVPFYLGLFQVGVATVGGVSLLRQLRILRILRVLKLGKLAVTDRTSRAGRARSQQDDLWLPVAIFVSTAATGWIVDDLIRQAEALLPVRTYVWLAFQVATWIAGAACLNRGIHVFVWDGLVGRRLGTPVPRLIRDLAAVVTYVAAAAGIAGVVFHQPLTGVWTAAGALSFVVGLALREVILDFFVGIAINIERPFKIGDYIMLQQSNIVGRIEEIHWRTTRLATNEGNTVIVPNRRIGEMVLTNFSDPGAAAEFELLFTLDFAVPINQALTVLGAAASAVAGSDGILADPAAKVRLAGSSSLGAEYKVKYWIDCSRVGPGKARHRVLESVFEHLHAAGIEPARERRDLVMNQATPPSVPLNGAAVVN